ncbi:endonuclease/exonuclease/phosphatase family protein [Nonomuraea sp. NPDC049714]|uniref:endonuclease/exonuclease/phosphatase family protein n=1 Tax=Nonomuraea sp. NPDC049714 TaxID=3364357 RepID=UPI0037982E13
MSITVEVGQEEDGAKPAPRRRRRWLSWLVVAFLAVWAVVRVAGAEGGSFLTQLMTLTPYGAVLALIAAVALVRRNRRAAIVALVACVTLAATVLPRAFAASAPAAGGTPFKVLTINLFGRADARTVVDLVRRLQPDVFSALELTHRQVAALDAAGLAELMPHRVLQAEHDAAGSGLYGRHPLTALPGLFTPIGHNMPAAALSLPSGAKVEVVAVHPNPPLGRMVGEWNASLAALPPPSTGPIRVLAGDFNASLDHEAMRDLLDKGYRDAAHEVGRGLTPTWPNTRVLPPFITIDHVLADARARVRAVEVLDVPRTDHRGVFAELRLPI